jgi:hypothetical protein
MRHKMWTGTINAPAMGAGRQRRFLGGDKGSKRDLERRDDPQHRPTVGLCSTAFHSVHPLVLPQAAQTDERDLPPILSQYGLPSERNLPENPRLVTH